MLKLSTALFVTMTALGTVPAGAQTETPFPVFTPQEIQAHKGSIKQLTNTAASCLQAYYQDHLKFFKNNGFSRYYGNRNPLYKTAELRRQALVKLGKAPNLEKEMRPIACIDLAMICLKDGFDKTGQSAIWNRIYDHLKIDHNFYGTDLQKMLGDLGWTVAYWNPDPSQNDKWDQEDLRLTPLAAGRKWMPVWGGHAERYREVLKRGTYYYIPVTDTQSLVGFGDQPPQGFDQIPFFVGTAHSGYHVFPGFYGRVIEAHSMRLIDSIDNFQSSPFNPLGTGGGPRWTATEKYRSGIIALPPEP
jgi:hypothetical protein